MSDSADDRVFGLIAAAEDQQQLVQAALTRLTAQEDALQRDRQLLAAERAALRDELAALRRTAEAVVPEVQRSAREAVRAVVAESLHGAAAMAAQAVTAAAQPSLTQLEGVAASAQEVEASLRRVVGWVTWRLLWRVGAVAVGCLLLVAVGKIGLDWWTEHNFALEQAQKSTLEAEIVELQDTRDQLVKLGMRAKLNICGAAARPCIRVDESAGGFGDQADYRIIRGY